MQVSGRVNGRWDVPARPGAEVVADLASRIGLTVSDPPMAAVVARALALAWTRDPFDRMIAAQAIAEGVSLLTRDETLLANCPVAVWG